MMKKQNKLSDSMAAGEQGKVSEPIALYAPRDVHAKALSAHKPRRDVSGREKIQSIRQGYGYDEIEVLSVRLNIPVWELLPLFELAQTTYNKKKREKAHMNRRDTEMLLFLNDLIGFGMDVFNDEQDKLQRWLRKPNITLGGSTPFSLLDTITGMREVRGCLERIEYGNFA